MYPLCPVSYAVGHPYLVSVWHPYIPHFLICRILFTCIYFYRENTCVSIVNGAQRLLKLLLSELLILDQQVDIIKSSITLLLYAVCKMELLVAQKNLDVSEVKEVFAACEKALLGWVRHPGVVGANGGSCFGYRAQDRMKLLYGSTELKV